MTSEWALVARGEDTVELVPRGELEAAATAEPCGIWAWDALRIARGEPRLGLDTDHRTIPNEVGWIGPAVHLDKGCYRGQETVARIHTLGRPPRRLVVLHLDGSVDHLPAQGAAVSLDGRDVGFVGSSARSPLPCSSATCRSTPSSSLTVSPPGRKSSSTPRSACTSAPASDPAR